MENLNAPLKNYADIPTNDAVTEISQLVEQLDKLHIGITSDNMFGYLDASKPQFNQIRQLAHVTHKDRAKIELLFKSLIEDSEISKKHYDNERKIRFFSQWR